MAEQTSNVVRPRPSQLVFRRKTDMIIGHSKLITTLLDQIGELVGSSSAVLITGEVGTEKDLVARALHYCGPRSSAPFISVACATSSAAFFESETFSNDKNPLQSSQKATIHLDEIAEVPMPTQAKIVKLMDRTNLSVRIVAGTSHSLDVEVGGGRFREDLHRRMTTHVLRVPALRERPEDIPALVNHHLGEIARLANRSVPRVTPLALERLLSYAWSGNIRELVDTLERGFLLAGDRAIEAEHVTISDETPADIDRPIISYREAKMRFEVDYYSKLMRTAGGNISLAARLAQKTRKEVYDALKRLGLAPIDYRTTPEAGDA